MDDAKKYKGIAGTLAHRCSHCHATTGKLLRCLGCSAVRYCNRAHQKAHWLRHQYACAEIKAARAKLAEEDALVRNATPDFATPANAFETSVGHFWGIWSTRDYMRARCHLATSLLHIGTLGSVSESRKHLRDMLRLCRGDNMGLRDMLPAVMLRLDRDQDCYDFIKWWATVPGDYDFRNTDLPYLNIKDSDVLEDPRFIITKYPALNFVVAVLLLKLKLMVDIRIIRTTRKALTPRGIPSELQLQICRAAIRSPLSRRFLGMSGRDLTQAECTLLNHARRLGATVTKANEHFMFNLFDPDGALASKPEAYSHGSWEEMALAMQNSYPAFWETVGVLELLNDARACAARDSEDEMENIMDGQGFKTGAGSSRTKEELLADVSVNRIWGYLDYAVENASYLGPWSDRPSERHTRRNKELAARALEEEKAFDDYEFSDDGYSDDE